MEKKVLLNSMDKVKAFVNAVSQLPCDVDIYSGRYLIDAKSIMGIFSIDISKKLDLSIHTDNKDVLSEAERLLCSFYA